MAANRVHHVEAVDRAHEFWVGGLHRDAVSLASKVRVENYPVVPPSQTQPVVRQMTARLCLTATRLGMQN